MDAGYDIGAVDGAYEYDFAWQVADEGGDVYAIDAADIFAYVSAK